MEQSCSSYISPLPFCRLSFSHSWSRAIPSHGFAVLALLLTSPHLSFVPDICKAAEGENWGIDWRFPVFCQPAQVLCVVLFCIPWNWQSSEEDNGVVTSYRVLSSTSEQPTLLQTEQWLIAFKQSFFSFLLQKVQARKWSYSLPHTSLPLLCGWEDGCDKGGRFSFWKGRRRSRASCWLSRTDGKHTALPSSAG